MESPQYEFIRSRTVRAYDVPGDQRTTRIEILFIDGSLLIAREYFFYDTERTKYSYHWMRTDSALIIRWDNAHPVPFDHSSSSAHWFGRKYPSLRTDDFRESIDLRYRTA